jgi:hypothetical protein
LDETLNFIDRCSSASCEDKTEFAGSGENNFFCGYFVNAPFPLVSMLREVTRNHIYTSGHSRRPVVVRHKAMMKSRGSRPTLIQSIDKDVSTALSVWRAHIESRLDLPCSPETRRSTSRIRERRKTINSYNGIRYHQAFKFQLEAQEQKGARGLY